MARLETAGGIAVETFDDVDVIFADALGPTLRRSAGAESAWDAEAILASALAGADRGTLTRIALAPHDGLLSGRRGGPGGAARPVTIEVPLLDDEGAVVLTESGGVYRWLYPEAKPGPATLVRRDGGSEGRTVQFRIGATSPATAERRGLGDFIGGAIVDQVRAYVLKFIARKATAGLRDYLERNLVEGLVDLSSADPADWRPGGKVVEWNWPRKDATRILFIIHGTFSTTLGSFGALGTLPAGVDFLKKAHAQYDAVLGFDHATLSATPDANAEAIVKALAGLGLPAGTRIDMVGYSRGGLIARRLAEGLIAARLPDLKVGRVVFVGSTNGGTTLARPENWKTLIDFSTNLAAAAAQGLTFAGQAVAATVLEESVKTIGGFVQCVVDDAIVDKSVPGLAAMVPGNPFIAGLDSAAAPSVALAPVYYALGASFDTKLFRADGGVPPPRGLTEKFVLALADFATDALMKASNDLVVPTASMASFGGRKPWLRDAAIWGDNAVVYHTIYFQQPEVVAALTGWLLADAEPGAEVLRRDLVVIDAGGTVAAVRQRLEAPDARPAVIIRRVMASGEALYYVRPTSRLLQMLAGAAVDADLATLLDLHEYTRSETGDAVPQLIPPGGFVVEVNGKLVGAVPPLGVVPIEPETGSPLQRRTIDADRTSVFGPDVLGLRVAPELRTAFRYEEKVAGMIDLLSEEEAVPVGAPGTGRTQREPELVAPPVECFFGAEMDPSPPLEQDASLKVTISRELLGVVAGPGAATTSTEVDPADRLIIKVSAVANCRIVSAATIEATVPAAGQQAEYAFLACGAAAGPAEIWIDVLQGYGRLARMVLQPTFVTSARPAARAKVDLNRAAAVDGPLVQLRIFDISTSQDGPFSLQFELESRDLGVLFHDRMQFKLPRSRVVDDVYKTLEGAWADTAADDHRFSLKVRAKLGMRYTELVPKRIRQAIWDNRDRIGAIDVISEEPSIPWEVLLVVEPDQDVSETAPFLAELGLVRWIANRGFPPVDLSIGSGRSFHVVPDYADPSLRLSGATAELAMLADVLGSAPAPATSDDLVAFLRDGDFDLLHFACHGAADGDEIWNACLQLAGRRNDRTGQFVRDTLTADEVSAYAKLDRSRPLVFINACQTGRTGPTLGGSGGMAQAFVQKGAGAVVAALWSIGDRTALSFAEAFYAGLKSGLTLAEATHAARTKARDAKEPTWLAYTVYGHPYARVRDR
ncbi:MAG: CHAT domain-containing protein [Ancalomicrobiaceae bacterium]|nr:CHAT domain-containing protein [Ancalomicrobiaceae bacterium]